MARKAVDTRKKVRIAGKHMYFRLVIVFGIMLFLAIFLIGRVIYLNKNKGDIYEKRVLAQQSYVSNVIQYKRGDIVDRNGNRLAVSEKVYNLVLDPQLILSDTDYLKPTEKALNEVFGIKAKKVEKILADKPATHYYVMENYKGLSSDKVKKFKALMEEDKKIKGVWFEE